MVFLRLSNLWKSRAFKTFILIVICSLIFFAANDGTTFDIWNSQLEIPLDGDLFTTQELGIHPPMLVKSPYQKVFDRNPYFKDMSYHDKCQAYFKELDQKENSWDLITDTEVIYHRNIFENKDNFIENKINKYKLERLNLKSKVDQDRIVQEKNLYQIYENDWLKACDESSQFERKLINSLSHTRIFGACFLDQFGNYNRIPAEESRSENINHQCTEIEKKGFPWLTRKYPTFKRWNGKVTNSIPVIDEFLRDEGNTKSKKYNGKDCFFKSFKDQLNGIGIVVTGNDDHISDLIRLIGNLRATGNELPIQIVHNNDLSKSSQKKLIKIARNLDNLDTSIINQHVAVLQDKEINLLEENEDPETFKSKLEFLFPPQELWFVDISGVISERVHLKVRGSANKLVAYLFNSFKEAIILDANTVIVSDINKFIFGSRGYLNTGSYFFKGKETHTRNTAHHLDLITDLSPSLMDTAYFGIPQSINSILDNRYFKGNFLRHMDDSLFAIDKQKHFTGLLASLQMLLWQPPSMNVWMDSELLWLGQGLMGDTNIYFNQNPAGSVGSLTPKERRLILDDNTERREKLVSHEICSQHSGHLSGHNNLTLLWYTDGLTVCSDPNSAENDYSISTYFRNFKPSVDELKEYYLQPVSIEAIIVPPPQEYRIQNNLGESERGWANIGACNHEFWCAYDKVGGSDSPVASGYMVEFDDETKRQFKYYSEIALQAEKLFDPKGTIMDII